MTPDALARDLRRLTTEGGDDNRLVLTSGPAWLLFVGARAEADVTCLAAPNAALPEGRKLGLQGVGLLRQAGFANDPRAKGLRRTYTLGDAGDAHHPTKVADDALLILRSVYGCDPDAEPARARLHLGDRDPTENPRLLDAIRNLAKNRDTAARNRMYRQMLRATFLVPLGDDGAPTRFGELMDLPVFGLFTDIDALRAWEPRGHSYEIRHGREVFGMLARSNLGSVLINPGGRVGGELYRNEVEMLADVAR